MKARFHEIHTTDELDALVKKSNDQPVIILKHSTTCPISHGVYTEVSNADADINLIVMQTAKNVSTALAERTGIRHESPQAIVFKGGKAVYHASHYDITAADLESQVN
ncbi:MAG: bacillithiol system redox-active protein YtxJ [Acidobacteriota bacterium]|nr:bacillithiol system redox-active protein YtxJ [Acidobacteriota bacterium]